jgi:hypothetical protein
LRTRDDDLLLVAGDGINSEDFALTAGNASDGTMFTSTLDLRNFPHAAELVARLRAEHYEPIAPTFLAYGAIEAWAGAVGKAGTLELDAVIKSLRTNEFETIYGRIGFDEKGDVYGYQPFAWYVWKSGNYQPLDGDRPTDRGSSARLSQLTTTSTAYGGDLSYWAHRRVTVFRTRADLKRGGESFRFGDSRAFCHKQGGPGLTPRLVMWSPGAGAGGRAAARTRSTC